MNENFENVVSTWYNKTKPLFQNVLSNNYPNLSYDTIDDLYQDAFMAVYENIQSGRISDKTLWRAYIIQIGMNLASKKMRRISKTDSLDNMFSYDEEKQTMQYNRVEALMQKYLDIEDTFYSDKDVIRVLGEEVQYIPEPCSSIIQLYYFENLSMNDISKAVNLKNADTAKSKKSQCMKNLTNRVKNSLRKFGIVK
jgi:RNA polymerase sigma factor (sigma-70 family)